jgi:dolichol-phosphate mannosyltransferase
MNKGEVGGMPESTNPVLSTKPSLSVVLSFYNEVETIPELVSRLRGALRPEIEAGHISGYELIFVNDASNDGSEQLLKELGDGGNDIKILTMSRNFGVSPCVLAGIECASGDLVVYMDADLQDPPELIPDMVAMWHDNKKLDVINTVRTSRSGESRFKLFITRIGYSVLKATTNVDFIVEAGDFKMLSRRLADHLGNMKEKLPFVRGMVYWLGFNQASLEYNRESRKGGETKFKITNPKTIHNFLFSALISFSTAPLILSIALGLLTSLFAFFFLTWVIIQWFIVKDVTLGWTTIVSLMLFLGGIQLLTIGINGLYINSIYLETKQRPNYIVQRHYGFDEGTPTDD